MASVRNSIGCEIDEHLQETIQGIKDNIIDFSNRHILSRLQKHIFFVKERIESKGPLKHQNEHYGFPVMTNQEKELIINELIKTKTIEDNVLEVTYSNKPQPDFCLDWEKHFEQDSTLEIKNIKPIKKKPSDKQLELF